MDEGDAPLGGRLRWARSNGIDFFYSFRAPEFLNSHEGFNAFRSEGYPLFSLEFGANPLRYYPVPGVVRNVDYIFMGSGNYRAYLTLFPDIITRYHGFIAGKGWLGAGWVSSACHRYLYARARVGLNLHGTFQLADCCELSERTYILAACGIPQLVDNPKLLPLRFTPDSLFSASTPEEYLALFKEILASPGEAQKRALKAQDQVFARHTTLHRSDDFLQHLSGLLEKGR